MSKNKKNNALVLIVSLCMGGSALAQTIKTVDDLLRSGKLGNNTYSLASIMPAEVSNKPVSPPDETPTQRTKNPPLVLTGIFQSKDTNRTEIEVMGTRRTYVVGDHVQSGWVVASITGQAVEVNRCIHKKCSTQTLRLGD